MCSHKDSVPSLVPEYKVETLYSGAGTVPEFWRGYQEKRCVHIGARRRIEPGHGARAPSVNTALADRQCMLGQRRAEVIFDLSGVFICCLGEGYGCTFIISCSCIVCSFSC